MFGARDATFRSAASWGERAALFNPTWPRACRSLLTKTVGPSVMPRWEGLGPTPPELASPPRTSLWLVGGIATMRSSTLSSVLMARWSVRGASSGKPLMSTSGLSLVENSPRSTGSMQMASMPGSTWRPARAKRCGPAMPPRSPRANTARSVRPRCGIRPRWPTTWR